MEKGPMRSAALAASSLSKFGLSPLSSLLSARRSKSLHEAVWWTGLQGSRGISLRASCLNMESGSWNENKGNRRTVKLIRLVSELRASRDQDWGVYRVRCLCLRPYSHRSNLTPAPGIRALPALLTVRGVLLGLSLSQDPESSL